MRFARVLVHYSRTSNYGNATRGTSEGFVCAQNQNNHQPPVISPNPFDFRNNFPERNQNPSKILPEFVQNPSRIIPESFQDPSRIAPPESAQSPADILQNTRSPRLVV